MGKKAWITVIGTQKTDEGQEDKIEFSTEGNFYEKNGTYYIIYQESDLTGLVGVTTSLKADPQRVVLNRMGKADLKQEFSPNSYFRSNYVTPYGTILMGIWTEVVESNLTGQGGHISLKYNLYVEEELISYNTLSITVNRLR